jgi:2-C-methyl-D-erythritol 4-phosphate cytidylyltransferase
VLDWSIEAARTVSNSIVLVVADPFADQPEPTVDAIVVGGPERSDSVRAGLAAVPDDVDIIVVHDAARPLATFALFGEVVMTVREGADGAIPGIRPVDTIKKVDEAGIVRATLDRNSLRAVQTPQAFRATVLRDAHASGERATDDAALVEAVGGKVVVVLGDLQNVKITHEADLAYAAQLVTDR